MFRVVWSSVKFSSVMDKIHRWAYRSYSDTKTPKSLWEKYNYQLVHNPLPTKCITAGLIAVVADLTCQVTFPSPEDATKPLSERLDWKRTRNFAIVNSFLFPPLAHYWYGFLSVRIAGDTFLAAVKRVALDQLLFAPALLAGFFSAVLLVDGQAKRISDKLQNDLPSTIVTNYYVWVPAQLINFKFIPIPFRVLWANAVGFFWNIYLSYKAVNSTVPIVEAEKELGKEL